MDDQASNQPGHEVDGHTYGPGLLCAPQLQPMDIGIEDADPGVGHQPDYNYQRHLQVGLLTDTINPGPIGFGLSCGCRLVIAVWDVYMPLHNRTLSEPGLALGFRYWCANPETPEFWQTVPTRLWQSDESTSPFRISQAVALSDEESDIPVGAFNLTTLSAQVTMLWGGLLPPSLLDSDFSKEWLSFIQHNHDLGLVHAWVSAVREWLRVYWTNPRERFPSVSWAFGSAQFLSSGPYEYMGREGGEVLHCLAAPPLHRMISNLPGGNKVIEAASDLRPRRIWDACANRVVPTTWFPKHTLEDVVAISHAWVAPGELKYILTSVNCHTWPVPLPADVNIGDIRAELLRCNIRYAWLDILCLRQHTEPIPGLNATLGVPLSTSTIAGRERLRMKEWESDVPLIGAIYSGALARGRNRSGTKVLIYLSGIGRPSVEGNWSSPRHWIRRAWTMQETRGIKDIVFAGLDEVGKHALLRCICTVCPLMIPTAGSATFPGR